MTTDNRNRVSLDPLTFVIMVLASMMPGMILSYVAPVVKDRMALCRDKMEEREAADRRREGGGMNPILRPILFTATLSALIAAAGLAQAQQSVLQGVASVIDGDTLEIRSQRIRLHGIDAPESGQSCEDATGESYRCGQRAALALSDRIGRGTVTCQRRDTDRYGRMVAVCMSGDLDLNGWMVANGHALAYRKYSTDYVGAETRARLDRKGIWAGSFIAPRDWRRQAYRPAPDAKRKKPTAPGQKSAGKTCTIKGNISRRGGQKIYHVPGQDYYAATRISPGKGERWFCSEAEARAAGWRRSKR